MSSVPQNHRDNMEFERNGSLLEGGSGSEFQSAEKYDRDRLFGNKKI
jgi:hypothetical protein